MRVSSILELVGNTPLLEVANENGVQVYAKMENRNPSYSVKDRACLNIMKKIKENWKEGQILVEATSGNFGIALAMMAAVYELPLLIVMPESMSMERRQLILAYGAKLELTAASLGTKGAYDRVEELLKDPRYVSTRQFENERNPLAHYEQTAEELIADLPDVDVFICGVGTGGSVSGIGKRLKELRPHVKIIAVEPAQSPVLSEGKAGPHRIQGLGANFVPQNFHREYVDEVHTVDQEDAFAEMKAQVKKGISMGISSGANVFAAKRVARTLPAGSKVATILCDNVERYLSLNLFE